MVTTNKKKHESENYSVDFWMNNKWPQATKTIEWFVEKFWPIPEWPDNWKEDRERYNAALLHGQ